MPTITDTAAWTRLTAHRDELSTITIADLFAAGPGRGERLSWEVSGLWLDLSRQRINPETIQLFAALTDAAQLAQRRDDMFSGKSVNSTEGRPALHTALRDLSGLTPDLFRSVARNHRESMLAFAEDVRIGKARGSTGRVFQDVVNIGIGGSQIGPMAVTTALMGSDEPQRIHYVANIDAADWITTRDHLDPETTLFLVASKTFFTQETMANARAAKKWLVDTLGEEAITKQFAALSSNTLAAKAFGINPKRIFSFPDWVGGRFSLWSAIGLSIAIAIGRKEFSAFLEGAHEMDKHFAAAPFERNLPVLLGLTDIWNRNLLNLPARAVLPYSERLKGLNPYIQQLEMESNGKGVTATGDPVKGRSASIVFGMTGTNGQHTFHQLLHQGPAVAAIEFIGVAKARHDYVGNHHMLLANMLGQAEAFALGTGADVSIHHACPGNRPNTLIVLKSLDAHTLGMLMALYEHKVFVEGTVFNINSFDQYGVEFGKALAVPLIEAFSSGDGTSPISAAALAKLRAWS